MRNAQRIVAIMLVLMFSITIVGCGSKTVAEVNGEKITKTQLDKRMKKVKMAMEGQGLKFDGKDGQAMLKALEQQTLEEMINQTMVLQAAKKEGVLPNKSETDKAVEDIKARFGGEKAFNETLKQYNYTLEEVQDLWVNDTARTRLHDKITANIKVTEADIKKDYDTNKEKYKDPSKITARAILIKYDNPEAQGAMGQAAPKVGRSEQDAKKLAEDLIKQLEGGADFAKLAKEKSEDERSKEDGGLVKDFSGQSPYAKGTAMPKEFDDAVLALKTGKYTKTPVKTAQGYYVAKLEAVTAERQLTFDEAKDKIKQTLEAGQKQQKFNAFMDDLRKKSNIKNKLAKQGGSMAPAQTDQLPAGHPPTDGSQQAPAEKK